MVGHNSFITFPSITTTALVNYNNWTSFTAIITNTSPYYSSSSSIIDCTIDCTMDCTIDCTIDCIIDYTMGGSNYRYINPYILIYSSI